MNRTDRATLETLSRLSVDGVTTISNRRLAEYIGCSRTAAGNSLRRLTVTGQIEKVRQGQGFQGSRYRLLVDQENQVKELTRIEASVSDFLGVRDLFRSRDLYGAGCLWEAAPKGGPFSVSEIVGWGVSKYPRTVRQWLMKLESLRVPLAESHADPSHAQRQLWTFLEMSPEDEHANVDHLLALGGLSRPRVRAETVEQHRWEQEQNLARLGMAPHHVVAERVILPNVISDPQTGCLLYQGDLNASGYGVVYAAHWGIAAHRSVWWAERGPVPAGHELHHECKVRACVNVEHLTVMTRAEHVRTHQRSGLALAECA